MNRKDEGQMKGPNGAPESTGVDCATARDAVPLLDFPSDLELPRPALLAHFDECEPCAEELLFVRSLRAGAPVLRPGFADGVLRRLEQEASGPASAPSVQPKLVVERRPKLSRAGWGLSAAALLILALGIGSLWQGSAPPSVESLVASLLDGAEVEPREQWLVAGAPHLDALPDELLYTLLQDIDS